jgi:mono/diheme cytochrome c family protein
MRRTSPLIAFLAFALCVAFSVVAGLLILHGSDDQSHHVTVLGKRVALTESESLGHQVFAEHCAACHELAASNSIGGVGPDLDYVQPTADQVRSVVQNGSVGSYGVMPAGLATGPQLDAVANYVSRVANRKAFHP